MIQAVEDGDDINDEDTAGRSLVYLGQKLLSDKTVADSVEALLGSYVLVSGF